MAHLKKDLMKNHDKSVHPYLRNKSSRLGLFVPSLGKAHQIKLIGMLIL